MEALVHDKPKRRGTFPDNFSKGYVLGTSFEHYRPWEIWMKETRATIISATVFHNHNYITNPRVTPEDHVVATAGKLVAELKGRMATHLSETALQQLEQLGTIIKQGWTHQDNQPRNPPLAPPKHTSKVQVTLPQKFGSELLLLGLVPTPQIPFQHPNGVSPPTPNISPTATPPRVEPPLSVGQPATPWRYPLLEAQLIRK